MAKLDNLKALASDLRKRLRQVDQLTGKRSERDRDAVRNHPLVEQGINRLIANLKLGEFQLDVDSGDDAVDQDQKDDWKGWTGETEGGKNLCDYEGTRTFAQLSDQSFFSQAQDGDVLHLPLVDIRVYSVPPFAGGLAEHLCHSKRLIGFRGGGFGRFEYLLLHVAA